MENLNLHLLFRPFSEDGTESRESSTVYSSLYKISSQLIRLFDRVVRARVCMYINNLGRRVLRAFVCVAVRVRRPPGDLYGVGTETGRLTG